MVLSEEEKRRIFEEEKLRKEMKGKSPLVSIILSFLIPGLGDLYCGSWIKALIFFALDFICLVLAFVGIGFFLYIPVWFFGLISAWLSARKSEKRKIRKVEKSLSPVSMTHVTECSNCGHKVSPDSVFCEECGSKIEK